MKNLKILIKFPTRNRPNKFIKTLDQYYAMAKDVDNIRFIISCDVDDITMNNKNMISDMGKYKNLKIYFGDNKTKIEAINADIDNDFDILLLASDDMLPIKVGYDDVIRKLFENNFPDGDGTLWFNDGVRGKSLNTLSIMGKKYYDRFGYIYHPSYKSLYCDNEFTEVSKSLNRVIYIDECIIAHLHPNTDISLKDELYERNDAFLNEDMETYIKRYKNNFKPRVILISFATQKFYDIQNRLNTGIKDFGVTGIIKFTDQNIGDDFLLKNKKLFSKNRGFGYWCWKPHILLETMKLLDYGDIVIYLDSANKIIHDLKYIIDKCIQNDIVLFDNMDGNPNNDCWRNSEWTKADCFNLMEMNTPKHKTGKQVNASYQLYKKSNKSLDFLEKYSKFCQNENILTDIDNITGENEPEFKDHRHDQSVLSLLAIEHGIDLLPDPSEWGNNTERPYPQLFWHCRGHF
jgi:hypothetical protein